MDDTPARHRRARRGRLECKADAHWRPLLEKWNGWLTRKSKRDEARAALAKVHDPRAVPSIWKVFAEAGRPIRSGRCVCLLRSIAAAASRAPGLAGGVGFDRRRSAGACRRRALKRDPREFAGDLIGVMRDPIEYEVREVEGPGKPGELYVHGEKMNRRFFYEAPPPLATLRPTRHGRLRQQRPSRRQPRRGLRVRAGGRRSRSALDGIARPEQRTAGLGRSGAPGAAWARRCCRTSRTRSTRATCGRCLGRKAS